MHGWNILQIIFTLIATAWPVFRLTAPYTIPNWPDPRISSGKIWNAWEISFSFWGCWELAGLAFCLAFSASAAPRFPLGWVDGILQQSKKFLFQIQMTKMWCIIPCICKNNSISLINYRLSGSAVAFVEPATLPAAVPLVELLDLSLDASPLA